MMYEDNMPHVVRSPEMDIYTYDNFASCLRVILFKSDKNTFCTNIMAKKSFYPLEMHTLVVLLWD